MMADPKRKSHQDDGDSDKRRRQEEALDEALKNTFPASDPVSVVQPMASGRAYTVRAAIGHEVERLEKYQHRITGCRVAVVAPSTKHRHGAVYRINIWVTIPPHENIVVSHQPSDDRGHVHVEVAIKHAFAAARRQIEALAQRASGKVKLHFRKPQNR